jgi:hypothetical protein
METMNYDRHIQNRSSQVDRRRIPTQDSMCRGYAVC